MTKKENNAFGHLHCKVTKIHSQNKKNEPMADTGQSGTDATSVRVALRVRPLLPRETAKACQEVIRKSDGEPQARIVEWWWSMHLPVAVVFRRWSRPLFFNCILPACSPGNCLVYKIPLRLNGWEAW